MAESAAPAKGLGALGKKVGPLPLGLWLAAGGGLWWYFNKQNKASGPGGTAANGTTQTGYGTDPAGNTGYIDPSSGYVYGSAEDVAALQSQGLVGANSYNTGGTGDTSGTGASGSSMVPPAPAPSSAPPGPTPTPPRTGDGGPDSDLPPARTPTPGAAHPAASKWRYPAPSGLFSYQVHPTGFSLAWNIPQGPHGQHPGSYTVTVTQMNGKKVNQHHVHATHAGVGRLHPGWSYRADVSADGSPLPAGKASIVVKLPGK